MMDESSTKIWIQPPDSFSFELGKWDVWKARFRRYLNVSGQSEKSEEEKIDLFLYLMGEEAEDIYLQFSERPKTLDSAVTAFDQYFNPRKRIGCLRASFHKRVQNENESVESFINDLQTIANECEYGIVTDELVRDRIIAVMRDEELSSQLQLKENLTLEETISIIKETEEEKRHQQVFSNGRDPEETVQESIPSTSAYQSPYRWASQEYQEVSSSTYNMNKDQLCFSEIMPDNIFSVNEEISNEDEEGETMSLVYDTFHENNITSGNSPNISSTEQDMNFKPVDCIDEELSNIVTESNDSASSCISESSIMVLYEKPQTIVKVKKEVQETSNPVMPTCSKKQKTSNSVKPTHSKKNCRTLINDLNDECLLNIFNNLPIRDLIKMERVCQRWRRISLKSWEGVKNLDIKNEFCTESIQLNHLEGLLRRCGDYLTSLNLSWLNKSEHLPAEASIKIINKYCKNLSHLNICYTWNETNYLHALDAHLVKNLKWLNIGNENFSDDHLPVLLKQATNLEQFVIVGYDCPENQLLNLSKKCQTLAITNSLAVSNSMLKKLFDNHRKIQNLDISGTAITPQALFPFMGKLKALALWDMENFFDVKLRQIEELQCPKLRILDLSYNDLEINGKILLSLINNCPAIEDLRLKRARDLNENDFKHLKKLKRLLYLDVSYTMITIQRLINLSPSCRKLKKLFCYGCRLNETGLIRIIKSFPELTYLAISNCKLTKSFVESALELLKQRKKKAGLTISFRSNAPDRIPDMIKKLDLENGINFFNKSADQILRITYGCSECNCSFERNCFCSDLEETLMCFT